MQYSNELINEVKELYPDSPEIQRHAQQGNVILGRFLDDSSTNSVSVDTILTATSLEKLQKMARNEKRKVELYRKWCDEYGQFSQNKQF